MPKLLAQRGFDEFVIASGVAARMPAIPGIDHPKVITLSRSCCRARSRRAIASPSSAPAASASTWRRSSRRARRRGAARATTSRSGASTARSPQRGGLVAARSRWRRARRVYLLQRKAGKLGATLGKTTGWIHRTALKHRGVVMRNGVTYQRIDDAGLHIAAEAGAEVLAVDTSIICAGQESVNGLAR